MIAHAGFTSSSRGIGIFLRNTFPLTVHSTWMDDRGRYTGVTGQWEGYTITIMSIYVPPGLQSTTFTDLGSILLALPEGLLVLGGDFSSVISNTLDRYPSRQSGPSAKWLPDFLEALGLADGWRTYHLTKTQHTFYSGAHQSLSHTDYILLPASQATYIHEIRYLARGISDHSPVWAHLILNQARVGGVAPINPWYLREPTIRKHLIQAITDYFQDNERTVGSAQTLWKAFKTVLRGQALSLISGRKKDRLAEVATIETEIYQLERELEIDTKPETLHALSLKQSEYKALITDRAKTLREINWAEYTNWETQPANF